jgi:hypothetical protein
MPKYIPTGALASVVMLDACKAGCIRGTAGERFAPFAQNKHRQHNVPDKHGLRKDRQHWSWQMKDSLKECYAIKTLTESNLYILQPVPHPKGNHIASHLAMPAGM